MKRRYYFDTSVFGGVFDDEFRDYSIQLFDQVKAGKVICVYSNVVVDELQGAPKHVKEYLKNMPSAHTVKIRSNPIVKSLAREYIRQNVVGETSYDDCVHIALASMFGADAILSWNFKHIVNDKRIAGYNSVNLNCGYREISIFSPKQVIADGEERN